MQDFKTKIRRVRYLAMMSIFTFENMILFVAITIALAWTWGSISAMTRNYNLQRELEAKTRDKIIAEIQYETLKYEQQYLRSTEYQELAARKKLGLVNNGEHVLLLSDYPQESEKKIAVKSDRESNFEQWMNFLLGNNAQKATKKLK